MEQTYFEGLTDKINKINLYIKSKSNQDLGVVFSQKVSDSCTTYFERYGYQVRQSFQAIEEKDKFLNTIINTLNKQEKFFFNEISNSE